MTSRIGVLVIVTDGATDGGWHALLSMDLGDAVVVRDSPLGLIIIGDYSRILHGNMATPKGTRFLINLYSVYDVGKWLHECDPPQRKRRKKKAVW